MFSYFGWNARLFILTFWGIRPEKTCLAFRIEKFVAFPNARKFPRRTQYATKNVSISHATKRCAVRQRAPYGRRTGIHGEHPASLPSSSTSSRGARAAQPALRHLVCSILEIRPEGEGCLYAGNHPTSLFFHPILT